MYMVMASLGCQLTDGSAGKRVCHKAAAQSCLLNMPRATVYAHTTQINKKCTD